MGLTEDESTRDLKLRLRKVLRDLLKPVKVKSVTITKADRYTVQGVLSTVCPIEKRESGRDFEVGLAGNKQGSIRYVMVDGRRLFPRKPRERASRRGTGGH
jgi:hypothetical protein